MLDVFHPINKHMCLLHTEKCAYKRKELAPNAIWILQPKTSDWLINCQSSSMSSSRLAAAEPLSSSMSMV